MANIRVNSLPEATTVASDDVLLIDGTSTRKITPANALNSIRPFASQAEAEAGVVATKAMSPLTAKQAIAAQLPSTSQGRALLNAPDAATQRTSLGLGNTATLNIGTAAGTVAAGDDSRITGAAQKSANLSDIANAGTARTNLGLGGAAVLNVGTSAGTVAAGDDIRFGGIGAIASQAEAEAGVVNDKLMSPLRTAQAITAQRPATAAGLSMLNAANAAAQTALLSAFTGDSGSGGVKGLVPAPAAGDAAANKFLSAGGGYAVALPGVDSIRANQFPPAFDDVNLPAIRRLLRINTPDLYDWGCEPDVAFDCAPVWATIINELRTIHGINNLFIPPGNWYFQSSPAAIDFGLNVFGDSISTSVIHGLHNGNGLTATGQYGTGGSIHDLTIAKSGGAPVSGGIGCFVTSNQDGYAADYMQVYNLNITSFDTATWAYGLLEDGNHRPTTIVSNTLSVTPASSILTVAGTPWTVNQFVGGQKQLSIRMTSGAASGQKRVILSNTTNTITMASVLSPNAANGDTFVVEATLIGLRDTNTDNVRAFNCTAWSFEMRQLATCNVSRCKAFQGVGSVANMLITGKSGYKSTNVSIAGFGAGAIVFSYADTCTMDGTPASFAHDANTNNVRLNFPPTTPNAGTGGTNISLN